MHKFLILNAVSSVEWASAHFIAVPLDHLVLTDNHKSYLKDPSIEAIKLATVNVYGFDYFDTESDSPSDSMLQVEKILNGKASMVIVTEEERLPSDWDWWIESELGPFKYEDCEVSMCQNDYRFIVKVIPKYGNGSAWAAFNLNDVVELQKEEEVCIGM